MSEPEVGTEVWVRGRVVDYDKGHKSPNYIQADGYDYAVWMRDKDAIPVSPPLDAPDGPGEWICRSNETDTTTVYRVRKWRQDSKGVAVQFATDKAWLSLSAWKCTWRRIPDGMFGAVENVETEKPLADLVVNAEDQAGVIRAMDKLLRVQSEAIQGMQADIAELQAGITRDSAYDAAHDPR